LDAQICWQTMGPSFDKQRLFNLPTHSEVVDKAAAPDNLDYVASSIRDPEVVLGLACLAPAGNPLRRKLLGIATRARPEYWPVAAVVALSMDIVDENAVRHLISSDPDNALGYYVQANLLYECDRDDQALEAFRKGAHCSELRLYEPMTGRAIFKALDILQIHGRDRLCALSWMACRSSHFGGRVMQFLSWPLSEWAPRAEDAARQEICDLLLVLAGHLFATNFYNRWAARRALDNAIFGLNAKVPTTEKFPTMAGGKAAQGLARMMLRWPGVNIAQESDQPDKRLRLAQSLPDRVHRAFAATDPGQLESLGETTVTLSGNRKAAFERARDKFMNSSRALIDAVSADTDGIIGPYLTGIRLGETGPDGRRVVPFETDVEKLLRMRPDVFAVAAANEEAMGTLWDMGASDPSRRNISRMMEINRAMHSYAAAHDNTYPNSIEVLFAQEYLKPPIKATSMLTGRPYVYAAAGEKVPEKSKDKWRFVVLYDDNPDSWGYYQCVFASWAAGGMRVEEVKEQLRKRLDRSARRK
jgi:hypothetical protein